PGRASPPPGLEPREFLVEGLPRRGGAALIEHDLLRQPLRHGDHPHRPPPDVGIVGTGRRPAAMTSGQVEGSPIDSTDDLTDLPVHHGPGDVRVPHGRPDTHGLTCRDERKEELSQAVHRALVPSRSLLGARVTLRTIIPPAGLGARRALRTSTTADRLGARVPVAWRGGLGTGGALSAAFEDELTAGGEIVLHPSDRDSGRLSDGAEGHRVDSPEVDDLPEGVDDLGATLSMIDDLRHAPHFTIRSTCITIAI